MEAYIVALGLYAFLIASAMLILKSNAKDYQKISSKAQKLKKAPQAIQASAQAPASTSLSRCTLSVYFLSNFTILNVVSRQAPNRVQLLLLDVAVSSLFAFFVGPWYLSILFGTLLSLLVLNWEKGRWESAESEEARLKVLMQNEVVRCAAGAFSIGLFLWLVSILYKQEDASVRSFLVRLGVVFVSGNFAARPVLLSLFSCGYGGSFPTSILVRRAPSNQLSNQFYKTSESEANVNDTLYVFKQPQIDIQKQTGSLGFATLAGTRIPHTTAASLYQAQGPSFPSDFLRQFPNQTSEIQTQSEPKILVERSQAKLLHQGQCDKIKNPLSNVNSRRGQEQPSCLKQNKREELSAQMNFKRRRNRKNRQVENNEVSRIIQIYSEGLSETTVQPVKIRKGAQRKIQDTPGLKRTERGSRSRPVVHEQPGKPVNQKLNIRDILQSTQ